MNRIYISVLILMLLSIETIHAQTEIETEGLEVIKSFEAQLESAELVEVRPTLPKIVPVKKAYQYEISIVPLELDYPDPVIKPLAMTETNEFDDYKYYLKLGYGTVNNPEGILRLSFYDGDRYKVNVHAGYQGLDNTEQVDFQERTKYEFGLKGFARLNENIVTNFEGGFERNDRAFYDTRSFNKEERYGENRIVDQLFGTIGISNIDKENSSISYELSSIYKIDRVKSEAFSTGLGLALKAEKRASEKINIVMPVKTMLYASNIKESDNDLFLFDFNPHVHFQTGRFMASVGLDLYHDDQLKTNVWPKIDIAVGLIKNYVQLIVGTGQKYRMNDLGHLMEFNPYTSFDNFDLRSTLWREYTGGLRGELNFVSYQAEVGYKQAENELLIFNDISSGTMNETIVFDQMNTSFLRGSLNFSLSSKMDLGGTITANIYSPEIEEEAWGLPALELHSYLHWNLWKDKLLWKSDLFIADQIYTKQPTGLEDPIQENVELNNLVELDTRLEFWPIEQLGLFAYAHNLLDNKYQRWHGYSMVGINFGGGLQVKF